MKVEQQNGGINNVEISDTYRNQPFNSPINTCWCLLLCLLDYHWKETYETLFLKMLRQKSNWNLVKNQSPINTLPCNDSAATSHGKSRLRWSDEILQLGQPNTTPQRGPSAISRFIFPFSLFLCWQQNRTTWFQLNLILRLSFSSQNGSYYCSVLWWMRL